MLSNDIVAICRFFLEHMYLDHDGWNLIFYTGKEPLTSAIESANTNVKIIKGRYVERRKIVREILIVFTH